MKNAYIVIQEYENSNPDPIQLNIGDVVTLGEKSSDDGAWANWIYCVSHKTGKSGWTPVQALQINESVGIATKDYHAKELTVSIGDIMIGDYELNGWIWCLREKDGESGWVPKDCLNPIYIKDSFNYVIH